MYGEVRVVFETERELVKKSCGFPFEPVTDPESRSMILKARF